MKISKYYRPPQTTDDVGIFYKEDVGIFHREGVSTTEQPRWVAGVWVGERGVRKAGHISYYEVPAHIRREFWLEVADMLEMLAEEIREFWEEIVGEVSEE